MPRSMADPSSMAEQQRGMQEQTEAPGPAPKFPASDESEGVGSGGLSEEKDPTWALFPAPGESGAQGALAAQSP
eukprot:11195792-Lingulodinium_polyedra.AAC.1